MKKLFFFLLLTSSFQTFSQTDLEIIEIDVSDANNTEELKIPIDAGKHSFIMTNVEKTSTYKIKVTKEDLKIDVLKTPTDFASIAGFAGPTPIEVTIGDFNLGKGQQLTIKIKETKKDNTEGKRYERIYSTSKRGEWRTTFGFNFIYQIKNDTYFSQAQDDGTFLITESTNKEKFTYHPTLMFTWISNKSYGKRKNWKTGLSGGIGYDFKTSLSVFTGGSLIYNENITVTAGLAFHNQKRLFSNYTEGNSIKENLTFDQLHTDYIRVNPFVSISFRLDRNPFK